MCFIGLLRHRIQRVEIAFLLHQILEGALLRNMSVFQNDDPAILSEWGVCNEESQSDALACGVRSVSGYVCFKTAL